MEGNEMTDAAPGDDLAAIRIVLVEPSHPGNIGAAARAMKNMGLAHLYVVNPGRFPDPQAQWRAAGAQDVLKNVTVCETLDDAVADCHWIAATSARNRRIPWPSGDIREVAPQVLGAAGQGTVALLFGRETDGLTNDELQRCHLHIQIPATPEYSSLNLAMAVQVVCYELYLASGVHTTAPQAWDRPMASAADIEGMMVHLEQVLTDKGFIDSVNPGQTMTRLRRMFTRVGLDATEVQMMRGILTQFE
jgi:tRNA (cytidine32/uridine32-2'-O)-methyltransferase